MTNFQREHYLDYQKRLGWVQAGGPGPGRMLSHGHGWFMRAPSENGSKNANDAP